MPSPEQPRTRQSHDGARAAASAREARAEGQLRSLELFGMRFGLDRMRRMMTVLGSPRARLRGGARARHQRQVLDHADDRRDPPAHGLRTGAYLSPHLVSYRERDLVDGREIAPTRFAAAVARAARAAERVNRTLAEDDHVTQFELLTAAAFDSWPREDVEVAVVEAGLGGRYDATSVIAAPVMVLTNVGLEHTRWLGPTVRDIAEEKLAVGHGARLVLGDGPRRRCAGGRPAVAGERGARSCSARAQPSAPPARPRGLPARNFALARAASEAYLEHAGIAVRERRRRGRRRDRGAGPPAGLRARTP